MNKFVEKLISISEHFHREDCICLPSLRGRGRYLDVLAAMLNNKNGFFAFESSLHVYSFDLDGENGVVEHEDSVWMDFYRKTSGISGVFFAEDIFGGQFVVNENGVYHINPETSEAEFVAGELTEWAKIILQEYNYWTGYSISRDWQKINGSIKEGFRLLPKIPFVLGGEYEASNLSMIPSRDAMLFYMDLSAQINSLPDGAQVRWNVQ